MPLKKNTKEIEGTTYEVTTLPFGLGQEVLVRFINLVGPIFASLSNEGMPIEEIALKIIADIGMTLKNEDVSFFAESFGTYTKYSSDIGDGKMPVLTKAARELHFAGEYGKFFAWLSFCFEVNFGGFFAGLRLRISETATAEAPESPAK